MQQTIVELAPFKLVDENSEGRLLEASTHLQNHFLTHQPGFIKRELLKGWDNQWLDIVHWENQESADRAMQAAMNSSACSQYFQLMQAADHNDPGLGVSHFKSLASYDKSEGHHIS